MWKEHYDYGCRVIADDRGQAFSSFSIAANQIDADRLGELFENVDDVILKDLSAHPLDEFSAKSISDLSEIFYDRSEGELLVIADLTRRSLLLIDSKSSYLILSNMILATPDGLSPSSDPESYDEVIGNLSRLADVARSLTDDGRVAILSDSVKELDESFEEFSSAVNIDDIDAIIDRLENGGSEESCSHLKRYFALFEKGYEKPSEKDRQDALGQFLRSFFIK